jgi:CheY-like chemotaxis protein
MRADLQRAIQAVGKPVRRVLVVDDAPDVLRLFSRLLQACDSGLDVITAGSGEEALERLRRYPVDLVLLDIVMPGMDGWRTLETMAQDEGIGTVPVYFLSAQDPADELPVSEFALATIEGGLSISKLLRCSLELSTLLLEPERGPGLEPAGTGEAGPVSADRVRRQERAPTPPL